MCVNKQHDSKLKVHNNNYLNASFNVYSHVKRPFVWSALALLIVSMPTILVWNDAHKLHPGIILGPMAHRATFIKTCEGEHSKMMRFECRSDRVSLSNITLPHRHDAGIIFIHRLCERTTKDEGELFYFNTAIMKSLSLNKGSLQSLLRAVLEM